MEGGAWFWDINHTVRERWYIFTCLSCHVLAVHHDRSSPLPHMLLAVIMCLTVGPEPYGHWTEESEVTSQSFPLCMLSMLSVRSPQWKDDKATTQLTFSQGFSDLGGTACLSLKHRLSFSSGPYKLMHVALPSCGLFPVPSISSPSSLSLWTAPCVEQCC